LAKKKEMRGRFWSDVFQNPTKKILKKEKSLKYQKEIY